MAFDKLIADLKGVAEGQGSTLAKSTTAGADDANIQAAGATGGDSGDGGEGAAAAAAAAAGAGGGEAGGEGGAAGGEGAGGEGGEGGEVVKSFEVSLDDGTKFQAVDATELLKSLGARVGDVEKSAGEALGLCVDLIKAQGAQIAELTATVRKLGGAGTGRQAVLAIVPKNDKTAAGGTTLAKSEPATISGQEFLAKAETAFNNKKLSGRDLALAEAHINRGEPVPAHLIQAVMAAA